MEGGPILRSFLPFLLPRRCSAFSPQPPTTCFLEFDDIRSQVDPTYLSQLAEKLEERETEKQRERENMVAREPCKDRLDRSSYRVGVEGGGGGGPGFIPRDARGH